VRGPARDSRTGVPLPARYFALVVRQASVATPAGAGYFRACVVPAGDPCEVESRPTGDGLPAVTPAGGAAGDLRFYYDDVAPVTDPVSHAAPAQVDAILENAGIAVDGAEAAVFVLLDRGSFHP
jgi:hypothetical protein